MTEVGAVLAQYINDAHMRRVRALHEAQKAGLTKSRLFVAVREDFPPESLEKTAQFIKENSM